MRVTDESGQRYQYFYDANNNMTELRVYSDEYGTKTNYSYDKDSRETKTKIMSGKREPLLMIPVEELQNRVEYHKSFNSDIWILFSG